MSLLLHSFTINCPFAFLLTIVLASIPSYFSSTRFPSGHASQIIAIKAGEHADVMVYTRGTNGAVFSIVDKTIKNQTYVNGVQVRHPGDANNENEPPTCVQVTASARIAGPASIKVRADAKSSRFGSSENFLVVCNLYPSP